MTALHVIDGKGMKGEGPQTERYPCFKDHIKLVNVPSVPPRVVIIEGVASFKKHPSFHSTDHHRRCGLLGHNQLAGSVVEGDGSPGFT
jgi:hypothetical protein